MDAKPEKSESSPPSVEKVANKQLTRPATATRYENAVCVRSAYKQYGTKSNPNYVLKGLNMTVPKGTIYGLLGASGCGKTTLITAVVGIKRLNSGQIWVLGGFPGSRGSGVPGPRLGYMPQEVALYGEFTVKETFLYFGWIAGMKTKAIIKRRHFLLNLLDLPTGYRFVKNLSGGQQRRMSLASALVHKPELLILDEPTVGLDPILRQNIWNHLVDITKNGKTTIILTTHYIEETRQANIIGFLRGGKILAEESPDTFLEQYNLKSLEDVFLQLAIVQNMGKKTRSTISEDRNPDPILVLFNENDTKISGEFGDDNLMKSSSNDVVPTNLSPLPPAEHIPVSFWYNLDVIQANHLRALIWKNFLWMVRNVGLMLFMIVLPVVQIVLFCFLIGHDPTDLKIVVSNHELSEDFIDQQHCPILLGCSKKYLSCRFLDMLKNNKSVRVKFIKTDEEGINEVSRGRAWGYIVFSKNFSQSILKRLKGGVKMFTTTNIIKESEINVRLDMSNQQISSLLQRNIVNSFVDFAEDILSDCDVNPKLGRTPIDWKSPIYGVKEPSFTDFAAPGVILTVIFFLSVTITTGAMIVERNDGMLERCLVAGITGPEILLSQLCSQFTILLLQTFILILFSFYIFKLTIVGSLSLVVFLCILNGLCGMSFGFVIACSVDNERTATYVALGSFLPILLLCGVIWPIEGILPLLRIISYALPLTAPTEGLRAILQKGWGMSNPIIYNAFITITIWILVFLILTILLLKFKKG